MLGRLKMTIQQCIDEYNNIMGKVFIRKWSITEAYDSKVLETIIKNLVGGADKKLLDTSSDNTCKV
jgi:hypothetical protein